MRLLYLRLSSGIVFGLLSCNGYARTSIPKIELGLKYSTVRIDLLRMGDKPVSQLKVRNCLGFEEQCSMYPEVVACGVGSVGQAFFCRFEWKSRTGQRFHIATTGENVNNIVVSGFAVTSLQEIKSGIVE